MEEPMEKVTIYTLARELNMSPSMVSRAFNSKARIDGEKRRAVLEAASKYGFSPNKHASRLSRREIRLAVLISSRFSVNTEKMLLGAKEAYVACRDDKIRYDVIVLDSANCSDFEYDDAIMRCSAYDGVLVAGMSSKRHAARIQRLVDLGVVVAEVQAVSLASGCLFASKHDEAIASGLAAEFLSACLMTSERKNILLFTGDLDSALHQRAATAFEKSCAESGLNLLSVVDMKDDEAYFASILPKVMGKYARQTDAIYTTSGLSAPLCDYLEKHGIKMPFVAFDTYETVREYMKKGIVTATISQNVKEQMRSAFEMLARHLASGETPPPVLYTDVALVLKSNIHQFD